MSYPIEKQIISGLPNYPSTNQAVIIHDSGNPNNVGANSLANEVAFMKRNWRNAYVTHWVGSGGRIIQLAPVGRQCWGCGPVANPRAYAQIELARTNNKATFDKDYRAYVWLIRKLLKDAGLPYQLDTGGRGAISHAWVSKNWGGTNHVDPYGYLTSQGVSKSKLANDIKNGVGGSGGSSASSTASYFTTAPKRVKGITKITRYRDVAFKQKIRTYQAGAVFDVTGIVSHGKITRLKTASGYITSNRAYVRSIPVYYSDAKQIRARHANGVNRYTDLAGKKKRDHFKKGTIFDVHKVVMYGKIPRAQLANGLYVTLNSRFVDKLK